MSTFTPEFPIETSRPRRRRELRGAVAAFQLVTDREVLVEGPGGTGKSHGILAKFHQTAWAYPKSRQLLCRATRVSMTESILKTWEEQILGENHPAYSGKASRANRHSYDFPNGSTVVVGGLDNDERLFSTEWDRIYVAEAQEISLETFEKLGRAMRNGRTPYHQRVCDVNPVGPGFWLNKRADPIDDALRAVKTRDQWQRLQFYNRKKLDGKMRRLVSKHHDNPAYWDWNDWGWTYFGEEYVMGELANLTGHRRARLFEGRWVAGEGIVFPEFQRHRHMINPFKVPSDWPWFVGMDPGYDHPCAILWFTVAPNGCAYVADELYRGGLSIPQHAADIHLRNRNRTVRRYWGDPQHAFSSTAQSPTSIAGQMRNCGISIAKWPRTGNQSESMVERVRQYLIGDRLKVFSTCSSTIDEFETWSFSRNTRGEIKDGDDQYEDANNHAMDVIKGVLATGQVVHKSGGIKVVRGR